MRATESDVPRDLRRAGAFSPRVPNHDETGGIWVYTDGPVPWVCRGRERWRDCKRRPCTERDDSMSTGEKLVVCRWTQIPGCVKP